MVLMLGDVSRDLAAWSTYGKLILDIMVYRVDHAVKIPVVNQVAADHGNGGVDRVKHDQAELMPVHLGDMGRPLQRNSSIRHGTTVGSGRQAMVKRARTPNETCLAVSIFLLKLRHMRA